MKNILLRVPHHKQPDFFTCQPACIKMGLGFRGIKWSLEAITKETKTTPRGGKLPYAAEFISRLELQPTLFYFDLDLFPAWLRIASKEKIARHIELLSKKRQTAKILWKFLKQGGIFKAKMCSRLEICRVLNSGKPVIVTLELNHARTDKKTSARSLKPHYYSDRLHPQRNYLPRPAQQRP